jgi:hypothetical protein
MQPSLVRFAPDSRGLQVVPRRTLLPQERVAAERVATEINTSVDEGRSAVVLTSTLADLVERIHGKPPRPIQLEDIGRSTPVVPLGAVLLGGRHGRGLDTVCRAVDTVVAERPLRAVVLGRRVETGRWLKVAWGDHVIEGVTVTATGRLLLGHEASALLPGSHVKATTEWHESTAGVPGRGLITWQVRRSLAYELGALSQRLLTRATAFD